MDVDKTNEAAVSREPEPDTNVFNDEDFVAFIPSEEEEEKQMEEALEAVKASARKHESVKGKERERESAGRKRKAAEIDYDDGYTNKKERLDAQSRRAPWAADVDWETCKNVAEMSVLRCPWTVVCMILTMRGRLHREVHAFVKYISPSPIEDEIRSLIVQLITNAVTKAYPDARVLPFGSYQTKLYLPLG